MLHIPATLTGNSSPPYSLSPQWLTEEMKCGLKDDMTMKDFQENEYLLEITPVRRRCNCLGSPTFGFILTPAASTMLPKFEIPTPTRSKSYTWGALMGKLIGLLSLSPIEVGDDLAEATDDWKGEFSGTIKEILGTAQSVGCNVDGCHPHDIIDDINSGAMECPAKSIRAGASYKRQNEGNPERGSTAPLFIEQPEEPESNATDGIELFEDSQLNSRSKAIASKTKEIEQIGLNISNLRAPAGMPSHHSLTTP
ncbi:hypothetical protein GH733_006443 [Mirounga leonina]|nr:hypothetical protein GH733_006443 [Mirounga leonina]